MDAEFLKDLARHQAWADAQHWKTLHANAALLADADIRKRLNHMIMACEMLAAMTKANAGLAATLGTVNLQKMIKLPRGPKGPFDAPAGVLLLQALTHSQHHRGQNAARMRELGVTPPMTDFVVWYAIEH
jgi:uncharacterized damage-inducible protein DinB